MEFFKNLTLSLLGFLLFLSLSIFSTIFMLDRTLLDPDFVTSEINRLDVSSLVGELFNIQAPSATPYQAEIMEVIDKTIADLEPWMKEQANSAIYAGYDYFMGRTESLNVSISTQPVRDRLKENLRQVFLASPPPEVQGLPPALREQYFNELYQQLTGDIPPTFEFTESSLPPDVLATLQQVRQALSYFQLVYKALIGFMVLLVLGIVLISRQVKDITRRLGVPLLTYGAFGYAGILVGKYFARTQPPFPGIPESLQSWMFQFMENLMAPLEMFSLGLLIGGIVLIIVSFVYKPRQVSS